MRIRDLHSLRCGELAVEAASYYDESELPQLFYECVIVDLEVNLHASEALVVFDTRAADRDLDVNVLVVGARDVNRLSIDATGYVDGSQVLTAGAAELCRVRDGWTLRIRPIASAGEHVFLAARSLWIAEGRVGDLDPAPPLEPPSPDSPRELWPNASSHVVVSTFNALDD